MRDRLGVWVPLMLCGAATIGVTRPSPLPLALSNDGTPARHGAAVNNMGKNIADHLLPAWLAGSVHFHGASRKRRSPYVAEWIYENRRGTPARRCSPDYKCPNYGGGPNYGRPHYGRPNSGGGPNYGRPNYGRPNYGRPNYGGGPNYGRPHYGRPNSGGGPNYGRPNYGRPNYGRPNYGGGPNYGRPNYGRPNYGGRPNYDRPNYGRPSIDSANYVRTSGKFSSIAQVNFNGFPHFTPANRLLATSQPVPSVHHSVGIS